MKAASGTQGVLRDPPPAVVLVDLGVTWSVQVWAMTSQLGAVKQELLKNIKAGLTQAEIPGARPGMDVNVPAVAEIMKYVIRGDAMTPAGRP